MKVNLSAFHKVELGKKIADCEFGFEHNQYFLSTITYAGNQEEAKRKGELRLQQVMSIFTIHTGASYTFSSIHVEQISGKQPFLYSSHMGIVEKTYLPLSNEKIEEVRKSIEILDKLPNQKQSTKRVDRAINYFLRGCYLERQWRSESFLNFFEVLELVSQDFSESFAQTVSNQLKDTLLKDLTLLETEKLRTQKRLVQFTCGQLGISDVYNISRIIEQRAKFSAHATLQEVKVSSEEFNNYKALAGKTIINYLNHIQTVVKEDEAKTFSNQT